MLSRMTAFWVARSARSRLKQFQKRLKDCRNVQNGLLQRILRANAASEFGRQHGFDSIHTYADFTQALPLANYSYFAPWIDRCLHGQPNALFGPSQRIVQFALTSGTTDLAKHIPVTEDFLASYRRGWDIWGVKVLTDHPAGFLRKILQVTSPADEHRSPAGIPCGAISGLLAQRQRSIVRRFYVLPPEVLHIADANARYYTIMRFAVPQDIAFISTANPSTTLKIARVAADRTPRLIQDVRDGTLDPDLPMEPELRRKLTHHLRRDKKAAQRLEALAQKHGRLLPRHYWKLAFLANWTGGTLSLYLPRLSEYYGSLPIRDIGLLASEGRISIPMQDNTPAGVLDITSNFYEFIPQSDYESIENIDASDTISDNLTTFQASQLENGQDYYIFLTNYAGLYRYNLGDLVRVVDHVGSAPVIEFLSKGAHSSSLTGEKLTEKQVVDAVRRVADDLAIPIETFIMVPQWADPPCYRLFIESAAALPRRQLLQLAFRVEQRLTVANIEYDAKRASERLGPLQVRQVPVGFLVEHDRKLIEKNLGRQEQFKHRFLYNHPVDLD